MTVFSTQTSNAAAPQRHWRVRSLVVLCVPWLILQIGGLFSPGLLDDVDSIYIQIAREMLHRHDFITPTIDGIRFFDKPPLLYWMAAGSMRLFGEHDWAARLPLALGVLGLILATYALGVRLHARASSSANADPSNADPSNADRSGLYAGLAMATSIGPYLYTRFYIPDILIALWMTLSILFLVEALDRVESGRSALWPSLGFGAVTALNLLTKGLIGVLFPVATALLFLAVTHRLRLLRNLHLASSAAVFLVLALPWHVLAALRNPAVTMPSGLGLPAHAGWAWFYLYNEHIARFLGKRIPHDYGQVPIPLFWLLLFVWLLPWAAFLPPALLTAWRGLRSRPAPPEPAKLNASYGNAAPRDNTLLLLLWAGLILGFFTLSSRQEYYHLPALPALALLTGGLLATADQRASQRGDSRPQKAAARQILRCSLLCLVPLGASFFLFVHTSRSVHPPHSRAFGWMPCLARTRSSTTSRWAMSSTLTAEAMGFFRIPLLTVGIGMLLIGPGSHLLRRRGQTLAANLLLSGAMIGVLLAVHEGLTRFYPILGSKQLAEAVEAARAPSDRVLIDGELTAGSTLLFYTNAQVLLVNGHVNGPWFGSFWPDAPHIFLNDSDLNRLWAGPNRVFLLTYKPQQRTQALEAFGPVLAFAAAGGKTVLSNQR